MRGLKFGQKETRESRLKSLPENFCSGLLRPERNLSTSGEFEFVNIWILKRVC